MGVPQTLPANFSEWDKPPATLPKDFIGWDAAPAAQNSTTLVRLANDPNNIPLDSYTHATERGLANIGQGVMQTAHALAHPIDTAKGMYNAAKTYGSALAGNEEAATQLVNAAKEPFSSPLALGDAAGRGAGQIIAGMGTEEGLGVAKSLATKGTSALADALPRTAGVVKSASGAVANSLDPDIVGLISPRAAHALRVAQKIEKVASKVAPEETTPAEVLADRIAAEREMAAQPPFPNRAEGLEEVETGRPQALELLKTAVQPQNQTGKALGLIPRSVARPAAESGEALADLPIPGSIAAKRQAAQASFEQAKAASSPVRTMPGQVGKEQLYGPYSSGQGTPINQPQAVPKRSGLMLRGEVEQPQTVLPQVITPSATEPIPPSERALSGDSALRQILTGQDNANLLKIAKSRGINVAKESQLKPGVADGMLINKIVDDFAPEELDEIGARYLESRRFQHDFKDIGPEAWKTLSLQTYFPDLKLPQAVINRTHAAILKAAANRLETATPAAEEGQDLTGILQESVERARQSRLATQ